MANKSEQAQSLQDNGEQFRLLAQSLTDYAIYMMDPDGFITTWNAGAARIKGYQAPEIVGQHFSNFFTEEDRRNGLPKQVLEIAKREGRYESEGWRVRKDGKRFWAVAVLEAIRDDNGQIVGYGKVTRDITERHDAREALVDSERRFRLLVDSVIDYAIFMLDPSGIITNWNTGAARIKGVTAEEAVGTHFSRFYTKEDRSRGLPAIALETARREGKFETEGWRVRKDGGRFWASVVIEPVYGEKGDLIGFAKITRDITERRSAQDALRESERQFRLLVSAVVDYAIYMLDPNGVIVSWNAGAEKIKGYVANEAIGSHFSRFYEDADRAAGKPARALYAATTEGKFEGEGWRVRKDGTKFWASVVIDAIRDETGQLIGFAKITRDITERREAQLALQRAQEQLAQSQKMDGQLTGGIAHDINNLLTILGGQARLLRRNAAEPVKVGSAAEAIETTVNRGAALTRQLLGFSRQQKLKPQLIRLADRMPGIKTMLEASMPPNIKLAASIDAGTWDVMVDASELDLAIMNLVLNARDALSSEGAITITAENADVSDVSLSDRKGDHVCINVIDNGSGISPDILSKIFDPFFTTKEMGKGTGLGLSQVYGFAHQSGGGVYVDTEVGRGTRVTICLPRFVASEQGDHVGVPPQSHDERLTAHILVVEDNADVVEVTSALIKQLGYTVSLAADASAALELLENSKFDLVLSDIMMPGDMDCVGLARYLRKTRPLLPVVLASGSNRHVEQAAKEFRTFQKPYDIDRLDSVIQELLRERDGRKDQGNLVDLNKIKEVRRPKT